MIFNNNNKLLFKGKISKVHSNSITLDTSSFSVPKPASSSAAYFIFSLSILLSPGLGLALAGPSYSITKLESSSPSLDLLFEFSSKEFLTSGT